MDMIKIGKFLAELRTESGLTQSELGKELGVTNKTVSRWENGNYLPPVEMLQLLSNKYGISINEILSAQKLNDEKEYRKKADENITVALADSPFSRKERLKYFRKKWFKDHALELTLELLTLLAFIPLGILVNEKFLTLMGIAALVFSYKTNTNLQSYIDNRLYTNSPNVYADTPETYTKDKQDK